MHRLTAAMRNACAFGGLSASLILALGLAAPAFGQATKPDKDALARYVPKDELVTYFEFAGFDAYPDAWKKSAMNRLLNETSLGALLEDIFTQVMGKSAPPGTPQPFTSTEIVSMVNHLAHNGVLVAVCGKKGPENAWQVIVLRGAYRKEVRGPFARLVMASAGPGAKAVLTDKPGGRKVVVTTDSQGKTGNWWVEKEDVVIVPAGAAGGVDAVIETLEGKRKNMVDHAIRTELIKAEKTFQPLAVGFVDIATLGALPPDAAEAGVDQLKRVDLRWGFDAEATMLVLRVLAPKPHKSLLTLLDQPTFDKTSLPDLPAGLHGFNALALSPGKIYDQVVGIGSTMDPKAKAQFEQQAKDVQTKTKLKLREDILGHIGPKIAFYMLPSSTPPAGGANPMAGLNLGSTARLVMSAEIDDADAAAKVLEPLIGYLNEQIKSSWADSQAKANGAGNGNGFQPPGGARPGAPPRGPAPQFEPLEGTLNAYSISIPVPMGPTGQAANLKPAIMLGKKHLVLATSTQDAKDALALEGGKGLWKPEGAFIPVFEHVPGNLLYLSVSDPRDTVPPLITNLPMILQLAAVGAQQGAQQAAQRNPGQPPAPNPLAQALASIRLDPAKIPPANDLNSRLFPGFMALQSDDNGVSITVRDSFFDPASAGTTGVMVGLLLPAVQSAREAARRAQCTNNLRQVGLALHNYHAANSAFPAAAIVSKNGKPLLSWRVALLPYIEQEALYKQFHLDEPWDSEHNKALLQSMPKTYACPSEKLAPGMTTYRGFVGGGATFDPTKPVKMTSISDGTANTIMVAEGKEAVPWTKPEDFTFEPRGNPPAVGSKHPGGYLALFADGSVQFLKATLGATTLRGLITRAGGERVDPADARATSSRRPN